MEEQTDSTITRLLHEWHRGDEAAIEEVMPRVYDELHRLANHYFRAERPGHTLQATAILNEALLRLVERQDIDWQNGAQFIGIAARMMRRLLVDHARERKALKRGGAEPALSLAEVADLKANHRTPDLEALDAALEKLQKLDPDKVKIIELRFFGGLTNVEIAQYLGVSEATVVRQWRRAKAWLFGELKEDLGIGG